MKSITGILLCIITYVAFSQNLQTAPRITGYKWQSDCKPSQSLQFTQKFIEDQQRMNDKRQQNGSRAISAEPLGTAGNMYTILNGSVNRVAANNDLNTVIFIHRSDPEKYNNEVDELARYRYDISKDGGMTWELDFGVLNPSGDQLNFAGRYPNVVIHNPVGNTNPDDAYLAYLGSWLPFLGANPNWDGHFTGVARLNNDSATFTETISSPNNSDLIIATGMCNGKNGEFWAANFGSEPFFGIAGVDENVTSILLFKGVWNSSTNDVDWTLYETFVPPYDKSFDNGYVQTSSVTVAFDPTGQYGWLGFTADCMDSSKRDLTPVFYSSSDSGSTWTGPIILNFNDFQELIDALPQGSVAATATYDADLVVDLNGNPHLFTVVAGSLTDTTILVNGLKLYDFTFDGTNWKAVLVDSVQTFRGTLAIDTDGANITEENRPQASTTPDGRKVFVTWLDSDPAFSGGDNTIPNLHARGFDVINGLSTLPTNFTVGTVWEGAALFASISPTTHGPSGTFKIPTVFTKINPSGYGTDPTEFYYINGVEFTESQFVISATCPFVYVNPLGSNPQLAYLGEPYVDPGAEAFVEDCGGVILVPPTTNGITSDANTTVNTSSRGTATVTYTYSDTSGYFGRGSRTVIVNTEPDADFEFTITGNTVFFTDISLYDPTEWSWDFDYQGAGSVAQNPSYNQYVDGTYNVCLEAKNDFNKAPFNKPVDKICKTIEFTASTSIRETVLENSFNIFPNPTAGMVTIEILNDGLDDISVSVKDIVGKEVEYVDLGKQFSGSRHLLNLSGNPDGVYFIEIQTGQGMYVKRTLVSR